MGKSTATEITLSHSSALGFWRYRYTDILREQANHNLQLFEVPRLLAVSKMRTLDSSSGALRDIRRHESIPSLTHGSFTHVLVGDQKLRSVSRLHTSHVLAGELPPRAIMDIEHDIHVASPSLTFLEMAEQYSLVKLIQLGMELCGTYSRRSDTKSGFLTRPKLTTLNELRLFVESSRPSLARTNARAALDWVIENAASPMESALVTAIIFPLSKGGYAMPWPELNARVDLSSAAQRIAGKSSCYLDVSWPGTMLDLEFKSWAFHGSTANTERNAFDTDARRANALIHDGYKVVQVTSEQITSIPTMNALASDIAREIGYHIRWRRLDQHVDEQILLHNQLFPWKYR